MRLLAGVCALSASFLVPAALNAQAADDLSRVVYPAEFFEAFSPSNALQMIERVPGFMLESGAFGVRGFGQAAGNVVINGVRPSSKSEGVSSVLSRIPASRVLRIEIAPGSFFGADYAGKPQVANVILDDRSGIAGALETKWVREFTSKLRPNGSASIAISRGASTFNAALKLQSFAYSEEGGDVLVALPSGAQTETRDIFRDSREPYKTGSVGWAFEPSEGRSAHINASFSIDPWPIDQTSVVTLTSGGVRNDIFRQRHVWKTYELSGDITQPLAGGSIKINGLATRRDREHDDLSMQFDGDVLLGGTAHLLDDQLDERVARLSWIQPNFGQWNIEVGGEGAYNKLTSDTGFFAVDEGNERSPIPLPIEDAIVKESRFEGFVNAGRDLGHFQADFGLVYEHSKLTLSGDAIASRTLGFLKPNASLSMQAGAWQVQLSAERTVAQLDFSDFVSVAEVNDDRVSGGNADLVPQRAWEFLASANRSVLGDGRIKLEVGYNRVSMIQDRVPTEDGFDAPGNLGSGMSLILRGNADVPLSRFGIPGGRLNASLVYNDTSVRDPYTNEHRPFSGGPLGGVTLYSYTVGFRQDLSKVAWGIDAKGNSGTTSYRRNEIDEYQGISPNVTAFIEFRPTRQWTAAVGVENLFDVPTKRYRYMYAPDRTISEPFAREYRERNSHQLWYVSVKRTIG